MRVIVSSIAPRNLPEITDVGSTMDNTSDVAASPARGMETMANHLLGGRDVACSGTCTPHQIGAAGSATWSFEVAREPYTGRMRCLVLLSTETDDTAAGTIAVTATVGNETAVIVPSASDEYIDAIEYEIVFDYGNGVAADMGTDEIEVVVNMTVRGAIVWSITFEPIGFAPPYGQGFIET